MKRLESGRNTVKGEDRMAASNNSPASEVTPAKRAWRSPRLEELGNLREFVRSGQANGKSGAPSDGASMPGGESMT